MNRPRSAPDADTPVASRAVVSTAKLVFAHEVAPTLEASMPIVSTSAPGRRRFDRLAARAPLALDVMRAHTPRGTLALGSAAGVFEPDPDAPSDTARATTPHEGTAGPAADEGATAAAARGAGGGGRAMGRPRAGGGPVLALGAALRALGLAGGGRHARGRRCR